MKVPLLALDRQYRKIKKEALQEIKSVCDSQHYILGKQGSALESEVAAYCGAKHAIGCASGTDALLLALMAVGVGHGDKVATTPFTFFATAGSIARTGATPLFVDIDPKTFNIDPAALEKALDKTPGVKAVMPVHLYGQCADMDAINASAKKRGIIVIEDSAQSIGAEYRGKRCGVLGDISCFSFYPTKNLGCFGDGGMLTTNDDALAARLRMLRVHGSEKRYYHEAVGVNSRLDEIQAAVLRVKLRRLEDWTTARISKGAKYTSLLKRAKLKKLVTLPHVADGMRMVYNQYVIRTQRRDDLRAHLAASGVGSEIYYPLPLHLQNCFKHLGQGPGSFPESEKAAAEVLALPIFPELTTAEQKYVVESIAAFYKNI